MLCFAVMTIEKAKIFMPKHKSKINKYFGTRRFPNLSNNQNRHTGVFMQKCRLCRLFVVARSDCLLYALMCGALRNQKDIYTKQLESLITKSNNNR